MISIIIVSHDHGLYSSIIVNRKKYILAGFISGPKPRRLFFSRPHFLILCSLLPSPLFSFPIYSPCLPAPPIFLRSSYRLLSILGQLGTLSRKRELATHLYIIKQVQAKTMYHNFT